MSPAVAVSRERIIGAAFAFAKPEGFDATATEQELRRLP